MGELYIVFMRLLASFKLEPCGIANLDPISGQKNPRDLIMAPHNYKVYFVPRHESKLHEMLANINADD